MPRKSNLEIHLERLERLEKGQLSDNDKEIRNSDIENEYQIGRLERMEQAAKSSKEQERKEKIWRKRNFSSFLIHGGRYW